MKGMNIPLTEKTAPILNIQNKAVSWERSELRKKDAFEEASFFLYTLGKWHYR